MGKITWSPSALNDIDAIAEFISRDSVYRASIFILHLIASVVRLQDFPFSGRIIPELNVPTIRELIFGSYRIMYIIDGDDVLITNVMHSAKNFKK